MIKQALDILMSYIPPGARRWVPLGGLVAILLLTLFGSRYLPPEVVAEVRDVIQTAIAQPTVMP